MFYQMLARCYDVIFPYDAAKFNFLDNTLNGNKAQSVLDLACGTGTYTLALAKAGYRAFGLDMEPSMIIQAKEKAFAAGAKAEFFVGDMCNPAAIGQHFDALFCIGNSLPHLTEPGAIATALKAMRDILPSRGVAIFQVVNFDQVAASGGLALPVIEREGLRFTRYLRPRNGTVDFDSVLDVLDEHGCMKPWHNSITLMPLPSAQLKKELLDAGFSRIHVYGDFQGRKHTVDAPAIVMVAEC